jgi:hypothetical protein
MLSLTLQIATLLGLVALFAYVRALHAAIPRLPAAVATKQDLREIIEKVDTLRAGSVADSARLRADTVKQPPEVRQFQYDTELKTYEDVWTMLVQVQTATEGLRPVLDTIHLHEQAVKEARDRKRLADFADVFNSFTRFVQHRRPFFPPPIYLELQRLMTLAHGDAIDVAHVREHQDPAYWMSARENAEAISHQVDRIGEVIRDRLRLTGVV